MELAWLLEFGVGVVSFGILLFFGVELVSCLRVDRSSTVAIRGRNFWSLYLCSL